MRGSCMTLGLATLARTRPGCVMAPLPAPGRQVSDGARLEKQDAEFIKNGRPARAGARVTGYRRTRATGDEGAAAAAPGGFDPEAIEREELRRRQLEESDRVRRSEFERLPHAGSLKGFAADWADKNHS
jgi:hypothetical protein